MKEEKKKDSQVEFYMQLWFKNYNQFKYNESVIWEDNVGVFKQMFIDAGFEIEELPDQSYKASCIEHPDLKGKEHRWVFTERGYMKIENPYISLYRLDGVRDYLDHIKDLLDG